MYNRDTSKYNGSSRFACGKRHLLTSLTWTCWLDKFLPLALKKGQDIAGAKMLGLELSFDLTPGIVQ